MLHYRESNMWKRLVSGLFKGATILGIGISLVITINGQTRSELVYANVAYGPLQSQGPVPMATTEGPDFIEPACGVITSPFGSRWGREHQGIDIGGEHGSDILAARDGSVVYAGWVEGYGNYLTIDHGNELVTAYAHLSKLLVKEGDCVTQGQIIAYMGSTGNSTGPHLHFEIKKDGVFLDPQEYGLY